MERLLCAECDGPLQYYSTGKVAKMLDVTPKTVRDWAIDGQLEGTKLGTGQGDWKFRIDWIRDFTERRWGDSDD